MKKLALLFLPLVAFSVIAIENGVPIEDHEYRDYYVEIQQRNGSTCTAQLLHSQWILTARHCVIPHNVGDHAIEGYKLNLDIFQGVEGTRNWSNLAFRGEVEAFTMDREVVTLLSDSHIESAITQLNDLSDSALSYQISSVTNDVALVFLPEPIDYSEQLKVSRFSTIDSVEISEPMDYLNLFDAQIVESDHVFEFYGWGNDENGNRVSRMQKGEMSLQSSFVNSLNCFVILADDRDSTPCTEELAKDYEENGGYLFYLFGVSGVTDTIRLNNEGVSSNNGDSGGALVVDGTVVGVVQGSNHLYSNFSSIHHQIGWIQSKVNAVVAPSRIDVDQTTQKVSFEVQNISLYDVLMNIFSDAEFDVVHDCKSVLSPIESCSVTVLGDFSALDSNVIVNITDDVNTLLKMHIDEEPEIPEIPEDNSSGGSIGVFSLFGLLLMRLFRK